MKNKEKENSKIQYKKVQRMRRLMILSGWLLCVAAFTAGGFGVLGISGKYNLKKQTVSYVEERENDVQAVWEVSGETVVQQEGWNRYEESSYSYNEDILTFLLMGIEQGGKTEDPGGYADALFLIVLNPYEEAVRLIPINCNTMTVIDIYDRQGVYEGAITAQIGNQYRFGSSKKESCEYQVEAVRNLFCGIPISGYLAVDMKDIPQVMALIDGFNLENIRNAADSVDLSAESRLERQSRILAELISHGKQLIKSDFTILLKIYSQISSSVVTDITADETVYLAMTAGGYQFGSEQISMIPGKCIGDEFYADEDGLHDLIADIFYELVD